MKFIPAYLEPETIETVDMIAKHRGVPRSAVIRGIIEEYVERTYAVALHKFSISVPIEELTRPKRTGEVRR